MAEELDKAQGEEEVDQLKEVGRTAVKVAASTVVASSLAGALAEPPHVEMMKLPEPVPIVQMYQAYDDDVLADEEDETDESESRLKRLLRMLRYLLVALALVGAVLLGLLKGCAGVAVAPLVPAEEEREEQAESTGQPQAEDERGVAVGAGI